MSIEAISREIEGFSVSIEGLSRRFHDTFDGGIQRLRLVLIIIRKLAGEMAGGA